MSKRHVFPRRRRIAFRSIFASRLGIKFAAVAAAALLCAFLMYILLSHGLFQWLYGRLFGVGMELSVSPQRFQRRAEIWSIICAALSFFLVLLPYVFRTIRRITHLNDEMEVLTGGDLSYSIEAHGKDELADLARSIEEMRLSVLEQMTQENEAVLANSRLITSLSHDLRTPLTRLTGYLEIMRLNLNDPAQLRHYLDAALENAMQMKTLSDEMFRHFRVRPSREDDCGFETVDGAVLFGQLISEICCELQDAGFTTETPELSGDYRVCVRVFDLRRIFNNVFSNIVKYADPKEPVLFTVRQTDGKTVEICQSNSVLSDSGEEGHGIGLPTMQLLTERNGGRIEAEQTDNVFRVRLTFPVQP